MAAMVSTGDQVVKNRGESVCGKAELITIFVNECGEHATWEEWCAFVDKYQEKGFEWIDSVNSCNSSNQV